MNKEKKVVITGIGPIASTGIGKHNFWQGIVNKRTGLELVEYYAGDDLWESFFLHRIKKFDINNFGIDSDDLEYIENWKECHIDMDLQYLLASVKLALDDSKIDYKKVAKDKLTLVVSHENPAMECFYENMFKELFAKFKTKLKINEKKFYNDIYRRLVKSGYETQAFMYLFHIARTFNMHKYSLFINNACASGLYAIEAAKDMIMLNKVPMVVVVAGDHPNIFKHLWFKMIGMYEPDGKIKPFSKHSKGLVMGEGAAGLVLEDYEHAKERGAHIYAEYLGGGFRLEGWKVTIPQIGGTSYQEAITEALERSNVKKGEIDLVCTHAPGTIAANNYEAQAIMDIFGNFRVPATAFKPYVGHNLGGSALLETIILLLTMENGFIPPVLNTTEIDSRVKIDLLREKRDIKLRFVLKLCCAFAGYNAALIFKKLDA